MIVGGHGDVNPNSSWLNGKGLWLSYGLGVLLLHLILLSLPFLSTAVAWTLTNLIHNMVITLFMASTNYSMCGFGLTCSLSFISHTVHADIFTHFERSAV